MHGKITGIQYKPLLTESLTEIPFDEFDVNTVPTSCVVIDGNYSFAISRWVSPKRTRSYPYERVYNTLNHSKKITVIPVVKDEGANGDRDFIQWDTVSLMSLLDVFVIFAYYDKADVNNRNPNKLKITNQQFNNEFVKTKIRKIEQYHSSALHWNLNELKTKFHSIVDIAAEAYSKIESDTDIVLHNRDGLRKFKRKIGADVADFMQFSRNKAKQAQAREIATVQPKERLQTLTKATITIENYLGGQYFLTADEVKIIDDTVYIIESKHSKNSILPSIGDIKDGLLKMILFCNLSNVTVDSKPMICLPILALTSTRIQNIVIRFQYGDSELLDDTRFTVAKYFPRKEAALINQLLTGVMNNNFTVNIYGIK
jgi:hypothetical protein